MAHLAIVGDHVLTPHAIMMLSGKMLFCVIEFEVSFNKGEFFSSNLVHENVGCSLCVVQFQ